VIKSYSTRSERSTPDKVPNWRNTCAPEEYVVVGDEKRSRGRVVAHEEIKSYDPSCYETDLWWTPA